MQWRFLFVSAVALAACAHDEPLLPGSPYAIEVVAFDAGENAGYGQDRMPDVVLGLPVGRGLSMGSTDVLSLGKGGSIVLEVGTPMLDGEGDDLVVFENAFYIGGVMSAPFVEPGIVGVSNDGVNFTEWPCDASASPYAGCAGITPVTATASFDVDHPEMGGGDRFDLAEIGVSVARFVRIRDANVVTGMRAEAPTAGFDLDAVAVLHRSER